MLNSKVNLHSQTDVSLSKYQLWNIEGDRRGDVISCINGSLWVTQEGDLKDYVLDAGQNFWVTRSGTVVVQALQNAQFNYNLNELVSHLESNSQPVTRPMHYHIKRPIR
jgi:hypothetical protein